MATETTSNTRTLKAYATELLRYPRWIIERDVDFTDCRHEGNFNAFLNECTNCKFGPGCRWLDQHRTSLKDDVAFDELVQALQSACDYLQSKIRQRGANDAETLAWIRDARRFLRTRQE